MGDRLTGRRSSTELVEVKRRGIRDIGLRVDARSLKRDAKRASRARGGTHKKFYPNWAAPPSQIFLAAVWVKINDSNTK